MLPGYVWMCSSHLHENNNLFSVITETAQLDYCVQVNIDGRHHSHSMYSQGVSLSWVFCDVSSPSMDPEGRRPSLRGHEKSIGRLSQRLVLAWGLLKAQTPVRLYSIFLLSLFPSVFLSVPPLLPFLKRRKGNSSRVDVYG